MNWLIYISLVLFSSQNLFAEVESYALPIVRNEKKEVHLAYKFWNGEYPSPVIDMNSKIKGTTKIKAFKSVRDLKDNIDCTITQEKVILKTKHSADFIF